ncbi:hypothetical protein AB0K93_06430 [Streptomyces sp. NPDC052676]|uniref:hypothetical protein n=1 Tax=Streptomyces sp. NPDC052676 TaxID=3154953 RepID=UPI00341A3B1D
MGIRMLNHRGAPLLRPVPAFSAGASTARDLAGPATALRRAAVDLRRRIARRAPTAVRLRETIDTWRPWADLARGYLALFLALMPRPRPAYTVTVFTAKAPTLSEPPNGSGTAPRGPRPPRGNRRDRRAPKPGATP